MQRSFREVFVVNLNEPYVIFGITFTVGMLWFVGIVTAVAVGGAVWDAICEWRRYR